MGNNGSSGPIRGFSGDLISLRTDSPLQFHDTCGDNVQLLNNKTRARRHESFCKGICFSSRPIVVNEKVYVKFVETNNSWSGVLRFGFTSVDPGKIRGCDLPRYACPDLTNKPGNWAKALGERYATSNILLHFSVNSSGDVSYGVNGEEKGIFFSGVVTSQPLWAMLDIYGNTVAVEFSHANAEIERPTSLFDASPQITDCDLLRLFHLSLNDNSRTPTESGAIPVVYWHADVTFSLMQFHRLVGRNARVSSDRTIGMRAREEHCNAFVFTSRPVHCGETVVIQVLAVDHTFIGGLGFGLTAYDPSFVDPNTLPDDSDLLLDRLEYWVVNKDVCRNPEVGDELSFHVSDDGKVRYARNNQAPVTLMHVDRTLPLWAFFDIYGNVKKIKLLGTTSVPIQGHLSRPHSVGSCSNILASGGAPNSVGASARTSSRSGTVPSNSCVSLPAHISRSNSIPESCMSSAQGLMALQSPHATSLPATPLTPDPQNPLEEEAADCKVCMERSINCVLYTCGHMCLCFECAMTICSEKGLCPICRQTIKDVVRIYRS